MNYSSELTIVFIGFDGYSDMWNDCFKLLNTFWADRPYKTLFVNNEKKVTFENVKVLHAGKTAEWSKKVKLALDNTDTTYICLLLEDFLVGGKIETKRVEEVLQFMKKEKIRYYKLANMSRAVKNHNPLYKNIDYLHVIPESDEYGVSLQAAIWEKNYLIKLLGDDNYNAWKFEFNRVKETDINNDNPKLGCVYDERNILNLQHGVIQSKYLPNTIRYFKSIGINLNIEREIMSYFQYFKIRIVSKGKYLVPKKMRKNVKRILEKFGMKFVSTERDK